jgi:hypothetical protein
MVNSFRYILIAFCIAAAMPLASARAAVFCVTTSFELLTALDQADSNFEDDEIRITEGTYPIFRFLLEFSPFRFNGGSTFNGDDNDLIISGGWISFNGVPCVRQRRNASALDTILHGLGEDQVMVINAGEQSNISISGLTFLSGGSAGDETSRGGGLNLQASDDTAGSFIVQRSAFIFNSAGIGAAASISGSTTTRFMNNLIVGNTSTASTAAVELYQENQKGIYVINNTIINNTTDSEFGPNDATGIRIAVFGSSQAFVANNILWGNELNDIRYDGNSFIISKNNTIEAATGTVGLNENNVSIAPVFADGGFLEFNLAPGSSLTDIGLNPPPFPVPSIFDLNWSLPDRDLSGATRVTNVGVDLGAFETPQDGIFSDRFQ